MARLSDTVITHYIDFARLPKTFYLLDTFEGIDASLLSSEEAAGDVKALNSVCYRTGVAANAVASVQQTFADFPNVKLIKGSVPQSLSSVPATKVAYLSIDMNNATPEIAAAEFFWPKMVSGGIIVLDDYAYSDSTGNSELRSTSSPLRMERGY